MNDDDLSRLRHELRTPLNQIIGYSEMLLEEAGQLGQPSFTADLAKIRTAAHTLLAVINQELTPNSVLATHVRSGGRIANDRPAAAMEARAAETAAAPLQGRVLVVDDNEMNRDMLARRLERQGCTVTCAEDGVRALDLIAKEPFDLVLLDVMMPELDGEAALQRIKANPDHRHLPVIMISALDDIDRVARCIERGADDYLPKPFDPTLLRARVGASLEKKALRDQEQRTHAALVASQKQLVTELADASDYVESLLPKALSGVVSAEWRFIPSTSLGGDAFGYHWIDSDHFAVYLLDVSGHGVGTALLSVSAINALRSHSLPDTDFRRPEQVLTGLNKAFQMDRQNNLYFTCWYGVYQPSTRQLTFGGAGHPSAVLVPPGEAGPLKTEELESSGMVIGMFELAVYSSTERTVPAGSRLFLFSDGAYEVDRPDGTMWTHSEFMEYLAQPSDSRVKDLDRVVNFTRNLHGRPDLDDDLSIVRLAFQ